MNLRYDEAGLVEELSLLVPSKAAAFAATCADRLVRSSMGFTEGSNTADILIKSSEAIWQAIQDDDLSHITLLEGHLSEAMPREDDDSSFGAAVVEDACAALIYAVRSLHGQAAQNAAWSARRAYETADRYASQSINEAEYTEAAELQILRHPVVQQELERQSRDLRIAASSDNISGSTLMREAGKDEAVLIVAEFYH